MKLAKVSREEGDTSTEKQYLSRALIHDSGYAECYHRLGLIAEEEGHIDQALQYFTEATRKNPESNFASDPLYYHYYPYNALMMIYNRQNRHREALQCVREILRFYPEDENSLYNQSYFEEMLKQLNMKIGWAVPVLDENYGPLRIRTLALHRALCSKGVSSKLLVGFGTTPVKGLGVEDLSAQVDTLIISNYNENTIGWVKELKKQGIQIICDLCEDILDNEYVHQILKESDMVFCCSTVLSEKVSSFHAKALVLEDPFENMGAQLRLLCRHRQDPMSCLRLRAAFEHPYFQMDYQD
jgi:tetratricopeptide (TPR) repeat protein